MKKFAPSPKQVREAYAKAVNPDEAPKPVTRLSQMSPEKIAELEKLYGAKVSTRAPPKTPRPPPEKKKINDTEMTDYHPKCPNPNCDRFMTLRENKFSRFGPGGFYGCTGYPSCKTTWGVDHTGAVRGEPKVK